MRGGVISTAMGGVGAVIAGGKAEDILFGMVSGAMVGMLNHYNSELQEKRQWEQRQVQRIYDLLSTKENLTYADIVNEIGTQYAQTRGFTGIVNIDGKKVRLCITIDITKNHLGKNLAFYEVTDDNYSSIGLLFRGYSENYLRQGQWETASFKTWLPGRTMNTTPLYVAYPMKFRDIVRF